VIGYLKGTLVSKRPPLLMLDVGGIGYEIEAPMSTFYRLPDPGSALHLVTHLVVREDAHVLYGFASEAERALFRNLLTVSGVGARIALAVLSGITVDGFRRCVVEKDVTQDGRASARRDGGTSAGRGRRRGRCAGPLDGRDRSARRAAGSGLSARRGC